MIRPKINTIKADIKNLSIYLRSTKKFGKTTLFRDVIIEKYGDPSKGLLIGCGSEVGYTMLDNINAVQVTSYEELVELTDWLLSTKGKEHDIEIVAFDTADELALISDNETIRISNKENPMKKVKSIKAAMGGYTAGEKYSANDIIKPMINKLKLNGYGVWAIAHTKFKSIKTKGSTDTEGYMQLTSNLGADYESAFGDIFDVVLTGVVDKDIETKEVNGETKRFATGTTRKLYFRETELIDAGGRFAYGTVPEYLEFNKPNMAADFIRIVEEGMEKSKTMTGNQKSDANPEINNAENNENTSLDDVEEVTSKNEIDEDNDVVEESKFDLAEIKKVFSKSESDVKLQIKEILAVHSSNKKLDGCDDEGLKEICEILGL